MVCKFAVMLNKDIPIAASPYPQSVSAIGMQDDEGTIQYAKSDQTSCGIECQEQSPRLQVDNDARTDTPLPPTSSNKSLDELTRTSSVHFSSCLDITSPPSILVTLSVHGDDWEQVGSARSSKDDGDPVTMSTGDIPLRTSSAGSHNTTLSQSSASSLRTLTDTYPSVTFLNSTSAAPPRCLFKGSSLRISRTYSNSTEDSVNSPPLSDHLCVPSLDARSHSVPSHPPCSATRKLFSTQTSPTAMSWLTDKSYGITPPFTRLGIHAPGVILPLTVREYQRKQHLKKFEKIRKEDVASIRKLSSVVPCSIDSFHGSITSGVRAGNFDGNALVHMDSPSFPRIFGSKTEIHRRLAEEIHAPAAQPLLQNRCTCEAGHSTLSHRAINHRNDNIRQKDSERPGAESKSTGNKRTTTSVLMKIVSKFNRGTGSTG